jgi:hypothetical protein
MKAVCALTLGGTDAHVLEADVVHMPQVLPEVPGTLTKSSIVLLLRIEPLIG